jgi:hypothetical protein
MKWSAGTSADPVECSSYVLDPGAAGRRSLQCMASPEKSPPRPANDNPTPARQRRVTVESLPIVGRIVEGGLVLPPRPR